MAHFFERDDLPGVSGKIIEEHGSEYYRCEIDGQEYPVKYELIRPSGFDYRTGAVENARSASTRGPRLFKADYVQQFGYYEPGYTTNCLIIYVLTKIIWKNLVIQEILFQIY